MFDLIEETYPVAKKEYPCDAWEWLGSDCPTSWGMNFGEYRSFIKAQRNHGKIQVGERYTKQVYKFDGHIMTNRAITAIHEICCRLGVYD